MRRGHRLRTGGTHGAPRRRAAGGTLRVPHGWWKPETKQGLAAGLSCANLHNDGMLYPDDAWNLDPVQGVPGLRDGVHARIVKMPRGAVVRDAASIR